MTYRRTLEAARSGCINTISMLTRIDESARPDVRALRSSIVSESMKDLAVIDWLLIREKSGIKRQPGDSAGMTYRDLLSYAGRCKM